MQNIDFDSLTKPLTWQDLRRYTPVPRLRYLAYVIELPLIFFASYAVVADDTPDFLLPVLLVVVLTGFWMLMYRYLHNRWQRHCKARIKKFAEVNNFTYEESASWSGTDDALSHGTDIELIRPNDKYIVSGRYAGHQFRLGLHSAVKAARVREFTYWRPFLRINIEPDITSSLQETYVAQDDLPVDVEYRKQCINIYAARWSFGMQKVAQSIPDLFTQAAYVIKEQKK